MKQMLLHLKQTTNLISIFQRFLEHSESDTFVLSSGRMSDMMWAMRQHGQVHNQAVSSWTHLTEMEAKPIVKLQTYQVTSQTQLNQRDVSWFMPQWLSGSHRGSDSLSNYAHAGNTGSTVLHHLSFSSLLLVISCLGL